MQCAAQSFPLSTAPISSHTILPHTHTLVTELGSLAPVHADARCSHNICAFTPAHVCSHHCVSCCALQSARCPASIAWQVVFPCQEAACTHQDFRQGWRLGSPGCESARCNVPSHWQGAMQCSTGTMTHIRYSCLLCGV